MRPICSWLQQRAENVLAAMLLVMFCAFLLQILFRYVLNLPVGWTNELSSVLWIWIVLFGAAFVLRESVSVRSRISKMISGERNTGLRSERTQALAYHAGQHEEGMLSMGPAVGFARAIEPVASIVQRLQRECVQAGRQFQRLPLLA